MYKFEQSETNPSFQFRCLNSRLKLERSPLSWQIFIRTVEKNGPSCFFFFFFFINNRSLRVSNKINNVSGPINFRFCCHRGTKNIRYILQEYVTRTKSSWTFIKTGGEINYYVPHLFETRERYVLLQRLKSSKVEINARLYSCEISINTPRIVSWVYIFRETNITHNFNNKLLHFNCCI